MKRITALLSFLSILLLNFSPCVFADTAGSAMIGDDIAVFYPTGFQPEAVMPSFALVEEPDEISAVPGSWRVSPEFRIIRGRFTASFPVKRGTSLYGTGEVTGPLVRNGTIRTLWNTDNWAYSRYGGNQLYQSHPWVLAVRIDGSSYGILCDSTWRMTIDLNNGIRFSSSGPPFRVIIIDRESPQEVMKALGNLTGRMELPPLWALGYQQCRYSYYPDLRVREIADQFRERRIPCDVIWHDIHYMNGYRVFTFDRDRFPDPAGTNRYLHERGFRTVWMIDPGVKAEPGYFVYNSGSELDIWTRAADGRDFIGRVWPGDCVFPDFTMPAARLWWASLYQKFMETGVDGVWNDMNEPALFDTDSRTMPEDNLHRGGGEIPPGPHARYHNIYGMQMVRATRLGISRVNPDRRPFVLTRANYLGGQRYAATWTGDNRANWSHFRMSIPMTINLSLSGQPFNGPDIGGFDGNATPGLFGHWIAVGAFYPFCRAHTANNTDNQEPWEFGGDIEAVSRTALERRYRLLPYLYSLFHEASTAGMPVMRPVFF
ncbi:MAG: TIM-barrel domain-containing protein, partial [Candidatus Krumholzibacteriota bacterium]